MSRRHIGTIAVVALVLIQFGPTHAHLGSPWHDRNVNAAWVSIGLSTVFLEPSAPGTPTTFVFEYPTQGPAHGFYIGYDHTALVFSDDALTDDGVLREDELLAIEQGPVFPGDPPLAAEFTITEAGYYHLGFGPGPGTSLLVLESPKDGLISVCPKDGGTVEFVLGVNGTTGDIHIVKDPDAGYGAFVAWIGVMFPDALKVYQQLQIAEGALPPLSAPMALAIGDALVEFGLLAPEDVPDELPPGPIHAPSLVSYNGLGTLAFSTTFLDPGVYTLEYDALGSPFALIDAQSIVLQVASDGAYDDDVAQEDEILASVESLGAAAALQFEITKPGWYHLMWGPGSNSSILHLMPTPALPVSLLDDNGEPLQLDFKLGGVNTVAWQTLCPIEERPQLSFPCKLTDEAEFHQLGVMSSIFVPISYPGWGEMIQSMGEQIFADFDCNGCFADCDENGQLNILDFVCFQVLFQKGDQSADCNGDGVLNILDFVCFQQAFVAGC